MIRIEMMREKKQCGNKNIRGQGIIAVPMRTNKENQPNAQIILQLEDARIGDNYRLKSIKKILSTGQELPESEKKYLQEQISQLQKLIDYQMMTQWAVDFVQKLRVQKKRFVFDGIIESLEKDTHKIDKKSLARTSAQQKQMTEHERKVNWTLDLISELKKSIEKGDKQSLKDKVEHLKQIIFTKIKQSDENGRLASQSEQRYLDICYEKLQGILEKQDKIKWTIQTIQKLEEFRVDDSKKFHEMKQLLEDDMPVPEEDIKYLREEYKTLQHILKHKKQVDLAVGMINELQEMEIGNSERLVAIKKALKERREVPQSEITYLEQKCGLLMIAKKSEIEHKATNNESQAEDNYNSILTGLNTASKELEKLQSKFYINKIIS